jgi:hypothetical protein
LETRGQPTLSTILILLGALVAVLLYLLVWALRGPGKPAKLEDIPSSGEEAGRVHIDYLKPIRQALSCEDEEYLTRVAASSLRTRVRRERRRIALAYLSALRQDFEGLLRTARVIAVLSPQVAVAQELERLRLTVSFHWRYRIIWASLHAGYVPLPQLDDLSSLLSGFSVRLGAAIKELGERAAAVGEMVSAADRRRINPV